MNRPLNSTEKPKSSSHPLHHRLWRGSSFRRQLDRLRAHRVRRPGDPMTKHRMSEWFAIDLLTIAALVTVIVVIAAITFVMGAIR